MRLWVVAAAALLAALLLGLVTYFLTPWGRGGGGELVVCNAGSLTLPLQKVAEGFEEETGVTVHLIPSGSVVAVRKVTDLHMDCDVVAVADYRLIPMFMVPNYTDWYVAFATNSLVIVKAPGSSAPSDLQGALNAMLSGRARYGFSDPNRDPCGYRAVGVAGLLSLYLNNLSVLKGLIIDRVPGARYGFNGTSLEIYVPASTSSKGALVIRPKSVDLISLLESGELDYAFEYRSVAVQHGLQYIELPPQVNLGDPSFSGVYGRVTVHILTGSSEARAVRMAPIVYGVTVPSTAKHWSEGVEFVAYLLTHGGNVFGEEGQPFLKEPVGYGSLPPAIAGLVSNASSKG